MILESLRESSPTRFYIPPAYFTPGQVLITNDPDEERFWVNPQTGFLHKENGPSWIRARDNLRIYHKEGVRHRKDGPAYSSDYAQEWIVEGKLHRINGPANISKESSTWYIHGILWYQDRSTRIY